MVSGAKASCGDVQGHLLEHGEELGHGKPKSREAQGVENDAKHPLALAKEGHVRHAIEGNELGDDVLLDDSRERGFVVAV